MLTNSISDPIVARAIQSGQLVVLRTDTIYGILASANNRQAIEKLYTVKRRSLDRSCIVLVANVDDIPNFNVAQQQKYLNLHAEYPTTIIAKAEGVFPDVPHQFDTLAFRVVFGGELAELIRQVGPLLAPSANPEGLTPASNIDEAFKYFGDQVSVYADGGRVTENSPSRIIRFDGDEMVVLR